VCEGLNAKTIKFSILLSIVLKRLIKALYVQFLVNFPLKTGYYNNHLSIKIFKGFYINKLQVYFRG